MMANENSFALEWNEKEIIELIEDLSNILGAFVIKQLFHSHLLDMRWRASLAEIINFKLFHARSWNNC